MESSSSYSHLVLNFDILEWILVDVTFSFTVTNDFLKDELIQVSLVLIVNKIKEIFRP